MWMRGRSQDASWLYGLEQCCNDVPFSEPDWQGRLGKVKLGILVEICSV